VPTAKPKSPRTASIFSLMSQRLFKYAALEVNFDVY